MVKTLFKRKGKQTKCSIPKQNALYRPEQGNIVGRAYIHFVKNTANATPAF
jgi:hypothetical protein